MRADQAYTGGTCRLLVCRCIAFLAAVYGWFVTLIGWGYARLVWAYSFAWLLVNSGFKIMAYALMQDRVLVRPTIWRGSKSC